MPLTRDQIVEWLRRIQKAIEENKDYLTQLDADIGDADHGINMDRGFRKVIGQLPAWTDNDIGQILKDTGMTLISSVGGASGPLYGTFYLRATNASSGKMVLTLNDIAAIFAAGLSGVVERGKAQLGDKTIVDALSPAVEALMEASRKGIELNTALGQALMSAETGMRNTIPLRAKKGRASYLGDRSVGHQDPGATSFYLILRALHSVTVEKGAA